MRIAFCYPPFSEEGRFPNLPQNRQFIYTASKEVKLYPVVMATAATWLSNLNHSILWLDGITRRMRWKTFEEILSSFSPEIVVLETKAPIMKKLWQLINRWKIENKNWKIVLVGDHVSFFPQESFKKSQVDFVLTGGDYDFLLVNLVSHLIENKKLEPGIYFQDRGEVKNSGKFQLDHHLDETPIIDRRLTRWKDYGEADVLRPCAYMMFGRGCGGVGGKPGTCTFCIWQHCLWDLKPRLRSPEHVVAEIKHLVRKYKIREIFDDTDGGAHYDYSWLKRFHQLLKKEHILGKISFSTNSRADILNKKTCKLLKKCGFRMLKVGVEAGTDRTLKKIAKGETVEIIKKGVKNAKDTGLIVHLSAMVGYPWEDEKDVQKTLELMKELLLYKTRVGDSVQASVIVPYPGTPLWQEAKKNRWFIIKPNDYEKYDMSRPVLKAKVDTSAWCKKIWDLHLNLVFLAKTGLFIRSVEDIKFLLRGAVSHFGHTKDYGQKSL